METEKKTLKKLAGKLKIGDNWNAITIIALSQKNPLKVIDDGRGIGPGIKIFSE